jgi:ribosomal protein S18 acetylase RimI-like enzyme
MAHLNEEVKTVPVTDDNPESLSAFWKLGEDYLSGLPTNERERFLQSILARRGEPDRWLLLLRYGIEYIGLVHLKIDRDERPRWGFILEFYIVPNKRRLGWGRRLFDIIVKILQGRGVKNIWLLTDPAAKVFWLSLGFRGTSEIDKETGQEIMVKPI